MPPRRSRRRAGNVDNDDDDANDNGARRPPFRPLQPHRASRSPNSVWTPSKSTPPREIILTPRATPVPLKRKASSRIKRPATKVKSEPPDVNLAKVRPPSPSDDPLLLSGTRSEKSPPLHARFTPAFSSSPSTSRGVDPLATFAARLSGRRINAPGRSSDMSTHALPTFRVPQTGSSAWSDSDDDEFNLTGEYTGKYKILKVPTKAGPPASKTSEHAEPWGRPVSPFPYTQIMERSLPLADLIEEDGGREGPEMWEAATEPPPSDVEPSSPPSVSEDEFGDLNDGFPVFDLGAEPARVRSLDVPQVIPDLDRTILEEEEEEEEEQIDRELSVAVDDGPDDPLILSRVEYPILPIEDGSSDEDEEVEGEDIIKITSDDPKAAARAAAILRMHDYDCILAAERKKRSSRSKSTRQRRRTIENAGISKSYIESKGQPWQTLQVSPGSRSLPLLELWKDAEDSVFLEHHSMSYCDTSFTLSPLKAMTTRPEPLLPPSSGEWTRDCWKCLDKCLVAEQLAVAAARGLDKDLFANMGDISKDAVLDRFVDQLGGETVLVGLGSGWSRDELILRVDVLIQKRRSRQATSARSDSTEPCYRGLLQEAMALSQTTEQYTPSGSAVLDATVAPERHPVQTMPPDPVSYVGSDWQVSHPRDPIRTPSGTPDPQLPHPKDQVHLRHASLAQTSMIPVPVRPKRLVDLRHLSPIKDNGERRRPAARRSSGCSVKDLVRQFESLRE